VTRPIGRRGAYWPCGCHLISFAGSLLVVSLFSRFCLGGYFAGFLFGFFRVSCDSSVYTFYVCRRAFFSIKSTYL
jgi:hypothetical protein